IMRHTITAQLLARAVKNLYPSAKLAIGPTVENGFYYDIEFKDPLSLDDLEKIEKEMRKIKETLNDGRIVYSDTNNSADDFMADTPAAPILNPLWK
ncbi:MAG TPA: DUF4876 domain-containing protein, partial [Bacteroidales bacterium]|nr:DUF4876 domain-containing protein [Bacteroidales bacterium]